MQRGYNASLSTKLLPHRNLGPGGINLKPADCHRVVVVVAAVAGGDFTLTILNATGRRRRLEQVEVS